MLPRLQVLYVDIYFEGLQADFREQAFVECISKLHIADAEETAAFDVIIRIQRVDGMFGVQQWAGCRKSLRRASVPNVAPCS